MRVGEELLPSSTVIIPKSETPLLQTPRWASVHQPDPTPIPSGVLRPAPLYGGENRVWGELTVCCNLLRS